MKFTKTLVAVTGALTLVGLVNATPAQATPEQDAQFFASLRAAGVEPGDRAIIGAQIICKMVWNTDMTAMEMADRIWIADDSGASLTDARRFVAIAIGVYCPPASPETNEIGLAHPGVQRA